MASKIKRILMSVANWIDRKFPDRAEVTPGEWIALKTRIGNIEETLKIMPKIEAEINKFNVQLGFGGMLDKMNVPFSKR